MGYKEQELISIQKELRRTIRSEKRVYKQRIEQHFTDNNMKKVWHGMRLMSGYMGKHSSSSPLPDCDQRYVDELNVFYNRFNDKDFSDDLKALTDELSCINNDASQFYYF